ncbi:hypothetical protein OAE48_03710 [Flavobacteriales bacterium]|nr:hypothetical protein [Flavobacteriales bacterium]
MRLLFFVLITLSFVACKKENEPEPVDNRLFVKFDVNGVETQFENGIDNYGNGLGRVSYLDNVGPLNSQFTLFSTDTSDSTFGRNTIKIQMVELKDDSIIPTFAQAFALFTPGIYNYGSAIEDSISGGVNGVVIEYVDSDSTVWSSDSKIEAPAEWSDFEITSHKEVDEELYAGQTKGTFNCLLFNQQGSQLELRNGSFHARTILRIN